MFQGTGKLQGQYKLEIEEYAKPVIRHPRRVPGALKEKLKHVEKSWDHCLISYRGGLGTSLCIIGNGTQHPYSQ